MSSPKGSILVTGANGGLGSAIVAHILKTPDLASNYTGLYTVRKAATASQLQVVLKKGPSGHKHETIELDLASLASVKEAAANINGRVAKGVLPPIRALILNAAYQDNATLNMSDDGFELTWQINFLANLVLSLMLLQSMDKQEGRILLVGSWAHDSQDKRNALGGNAVYKDPKWHNLFPGPEALAKGKWSTPQDDASTDSGFRRYGASKLCAVMLMHELGDRIAKDPTLSNISVLGLDPGGMPSDIARRGSFVTATLLMKMVVPLMAPVMVRWDPNGAVRPLWKSAADAIRACFEIEAPRGTALYLNGTEEFETSKDAQDREKRKTLWKYGLEAADIKSGDTILVDWQ